MTEIKKLILKDNPGFIVESCLDEDRLLSILTNGSTGRNPTFFKAYGHEAVFGLRSAIPEGGSTLEVSENVTKLDAAETNESDQPGTNNTIETNVLYVKLPEGHPVITADNDQDISNKTNTAPVELSIEEAIEQAEVIFDDGETVQLDHDQEQLIGILSCQYDLTENYLVIQKLMIHNLFSLF